MQDKDQKYGTSAFSLCNETTRYLKVREEGSRERERGREGLKSMRIHLFTIPSGEEAEKII